MFRLGVFLSGGIDSSAVAALASEAAPGAVHTFTVGFDVAAYDERRYAEQVASATGSQHTCVVLSEETFLEQLPDAFTAIDQPTFDGINTYFVSRAARGAGMTVALAGTGGDELFGGYPSFAWRFRARFASASGCRSALPPPRRALARGWPITSPGMFSVPLFLKPARGKTVDLIRASGRCARPLSGLVRPFYPSTQTILANKVVGKARQDQFFGLPQDVAREWRQRIDGNDALHAVSLLEMSSFVGERLLRDTDAASMAVSLEARVPLLDHVLAETIAGIDLSRRFLPLRAQTLAGTCPEQSGPGHIRAPQDRLRAPHRCLGASAVTAGHGGGVRGRGTLPACRAAEQGGADAMAGFHPGAARHSTGLASGRCTYSFGGAVNTTLHSRREVGQRDWSLQGLQRLGGGSLSVGVPLDRTKRSRTMAASKSISVRRTSPTAHDSPAKANTQTGMPSQEGMGGTTWREPT